MEQSLTELFDSLVALSVWLDGEVENTSQDFTSQLRFRLDEIKQLKNKVQIESHNKN